MIGPHVFLSLKQNTVPLTVLFVIVFCVGAHFAYVFLLVVSSFQATESGGLEGGLPQDL